jgi:TPP-dependent pyruvate/acetoin dehydrogenase alpha subunit
VPILYVVENNRIAQTTPIDLALAGEIGARFQAFGIPVLEMDSSDVLEIQAAAEEMIQAVREQPRPQALVLHTCRFGPHSKGDDTRPTSEVERLRQERDPLTIHAARIPQLERETIEDEIKSEVALAYNQALGDPFPSLGDSQTKK